MAHIKVTGDFIQIKSTITEDMYAKAQNYKPETLELRDEEGNPTFKIAVGEASQSKFGITFSNTDAAGFLFVTAENPCHDHSCVVQEREMIKAAYAVPIANLKAVEKQVSDAASELDSLAAAVEDAIEFTDDYTMECECDSEEVSLADCLDC